VVADAGSTNGTRVNGEPVRGEQVLEVGDRIQLGPTVALRFGAKGDPETDQAGLTQRGTLRDVATGLYNRRYLDERMREEAAFARRREQSLALVVVGIGPLHKVTEDEAPAAIDTILSHWARLVRTAVRAEDVIVRSGLDRIAVLCRDTDDVAVGVLARRLCGLLAEVHVEHGGRLLSFPLSIGASAARGKAIDELLGRAERALESAWSAGGSCVRVA
jgi:diguanylate cyclase (GGDEF)-like protein